VVRFVALFVLVGVLAGCPHGPEAANVLCSNYRPIRGECMRSTIRESEVDDPLLVVFDFTYSWQGEATKPYPVAWQVRRSRIDEARAAARERIPCERMVATHACSPAWVLPDLAAVRPPPDPGLRAREQLCPPQHAGPLNPSVGPLPTAEIAAAFLPGAGPWRRTSTSDGEAIYSQDARRVRIVIGDMIHTCTGVANTDLLLDTEAVGEPDTRRERRMTATSAVVVEWRDPAGPWRPRVLVMWLGGRCRISVEPLDPNVVPDDLAIAGRAIDVGRLERVCAMR
jgi:hypothetical protein